MATMVARGENSALGHRPEGVEASVSCVLRWRKDIEGDELLPIDS